MADFNSSLPVRTENAGDVISKIADATTPSQQLKVEADGSINVNVENPSLVVTATDLDIRDLVFATDKVDVSGSSIALDAGTLAALESITVQNPGGASAVNIQDGGNSITVDATDLDIRDLTAASDSVESWLVDEAGNAFSASNPLPVSLVDGLGSEINNYDVQANLAGGASDNHDYTVPGGNDFLFKRVWASASGKLKIEVQVDTGSGFNTIAVGFNSTATPNIMIEFGPVQLAPTNVVRVIRTNRDNQAQDVYSTIIGVILA